MTDVDLAAEMVRCWDARLDIDVDGFFDRCRVPAEARTDFALAAILRQAQALVDARDANPCRYARKGCNHALPCTREYDTCAFARYFDCLMEESWRK